MNQLPLSVRLAVVAIVIAVGNDRIAAQQPDVVNIELRNRIVLGHRNVRIADVGTLTGGSVGLRQQLGDLDVDVLPPEGQTTTVSRLQIEYRVRLAGLSRNLVAFSGATETLVVPDRRPVLADQVVQAAFDAVYQRIKLPRNELVVRTAQPVMAQLPLVADGETVSIQAEPHRPNVGPGRVQMNVTIKVDGEHRMSLPVYLEVIAVQEVAVTRRSLEQGEFVTEGEIIRERRAVPPSNRNPVRPESIIGQRVRKPVAAGLILTSAEVETAEKLDAEVLVRAGQPVRLVVKLGAIDIVTIGDALQNGRQGQTVQVRNADTKKIMTGRVTSSKTVEIDSGSQARR